MSFDLKIDELEELKCVSEKIIVINDDEGKRRIKFRLINRHLISHCYIKSSAIITKGESCDYIIRKEGVDVKMLLELKGDGDKRKAVSQIRATWNFLKMKYPMDFQTIYAIIITDRCVTPELYRLDMVKLKVQCVKTGGDLFDIKSNVDFELN